MKAAIPIVNAIIDIHIDKLLASDFDDGAGVGAGAETTGAGVQVEAGTEMEAAAAEAAPIGNNGNGRLGLVRQLDTEAVPIALVVMHEVGEQVPLVQKLTVKLGV